MHGYVLQVFAASGDTGTDLASFDKCLVVELYP